jgi:hypothetical protein
MRFQATHKLVTYLLVLARCRAGQHAAGGGGLVPGGVGAVAGSSGRVAALMIAAVPLRGSLAVTCAPAGWRRCRPDLGWC